MMVLRSLQIAVPLLKMKIPEVRTFFITFLGNLTSLSESGLIKLSSCGDIFHFRNFLDILLAFASHLYRLAVYDFDLLDVI